jgi:hypothetical protein
MKELGTAMQAGQVVNESQLSKLEAACRLVHGDEGFCIFYRPKWGSFNPKVFSQQPYGKDPKLGLPTM